MRWGLEFMILVGIDDQFGFAAKRFEGLIHLLATEDGDVPIDIFPDEESGMCDVLHVVEGGNAIPDVTMLPRQPKLRDVIAGVLGVAPHAGELRSTCPGDGTLEAASLPNDAVRTND